MIRTPQTIAAHMTHVLTPAVTAAEALTQPTPSLHRRVIGSAVLLARVDLRAIAASLAAERTQARAGRPRGERGGGKGSGRGGSTSTTEDVAGELWRIRDVGLQLAEALDRLHPDPTWPAVTSGLRARTTCATELVASCAGACFGSLNPERAWDDLADSIDGLEIAVRHVLTNARRAERTRAWRAAPIDVDPPDQTLEAARCSSWPLGKDRNGEPIRCGNYRGAHGHIHPDTGVHHHDDLCDDCYRLLCPRCWSRIRRTPGAGECMACEIAQRRQRVAAGMSHGAHSR